MSEKEILQNLKKLNAEKIISILKKPEKYFQTYESYKDIALLKKMCKEFGVEIKFSPFLARGLSYYNWIIFEIKSNIKETITAGGSYLINGVQSSGISFGLDRLELIADIKETGKKVLIISLDQDKKAIELASLLRKNIIPTQLFYGKPGKALEYANSYNIPFVIFVGEDEVKKKKYKMKNMKTGKETFVNEKDIVKKLFE